MIPEHEETIRYISMKLDENERRRADAPDEGEGHDRRPRGGITGDKGCKTANTSKRPGAAQRTAPGRFSPPEACARTVKAFGAVRPHMAATKPAALLTGCRYVAFWRGGGKRQKDAPAKTDCARAGPCGRRKTLSRLARRAGGKPRRRQMPVYAPHCRRKRRRAPARAGSLAQRPAAKLRRRGGEKRAGRTAARWKAATGAPAPCSCAWQYALKRRNR